MIKYKGIEFETSKEVHEFIQLEKTETEPVIGPITDTEELVPEVEKWNKEVVPAAQNKKEVTKEIKEMGLTEPVRHRRKGDTWTKGDDAKLRGFYALACMNGRLRHGSGKLIKQIMPHRTQESIYARAMVLGLTKSKQQPYNEDMDKSNSNTTWSENELNILKEHCFNEEYNDPNVEAMTERVKQLLPGRSAHAVYVKAERIGLIREHKKHMIRKKPLKPLTPDELRIQKATYNTKPKISDTDLIFPTIYPMAEGSMAVFENMVKGVIANGGRLSYFEVRNSTMLDKGKEWSGRHWGEFCNQFMLNISQICKAMLCKPNKLKVIIDGRYQFIEYK